MKVTLIDMSVVIYQCYFRNYKSHKEGRQSKDTVRNYMKLELVNLFAPAVTKGYEVVLIFDKKRDKKYWRQEFIESNAEFYRNLWDDENTGRGHNTGEGPNEEGYKGGRLKATEYTSLLDRTREAAELLKLDYPFFEEPGLEADDWYGLLVKYKGVTDCIDIVSVDRDLSGLLKVGDKAIRFVDMYPKRRYSIHYSEDIVSYFQEKLHPSIETPEEAYYWKQQLGESGDNLLPGCHIELIDLVNHCAPISMGFEHCHERAKDFWNRTKSS